MDGKLCITKRVKENTSFQSSRLIQRKFYSLLVFIVIMMPGLSHAQQCDALYPSGMQTHDPVGTIKFGLNAQLHNNPTSSLVTSSVSNSWFSLFKSCESSKCQANGNSTAPFLLSSFPSTDSVADVYVPWLGESFIGENSVNQFNTVYLGVAALLEFSDTNDTYLIKHLDARLDATLLMPPGDYWIETLTLGSGVNLKVKGEGTVRLFVKNNVVLPWETDFNSLDGSPEDNAHQLFIYSGGDIQVNPSAKIAAIIYAAGDARLSELSDVYGAINAKSITMGASSDFYYQNNVHDQADLKGICGDAGIQDLDGDGIADSLDYDIDGDGFNNQIEQQVGTNPLDVNDVPEDLNGNGIADALENYDNSCVAAFQDGIQSHADTGTIVFDLDAQLREGSSYGLLTNSLTSDLDSTLPSCGSLFCYEAGYTVDLLVDQTFIESTLPDTLVIPDNSTEVLGEDNMTEYPAITLGNASMLDFSSVNNEYVIKSLTINNNSTINLPAGDYWLGSLTIGSEAKINIVGAGTVRIYVKESVNIGTQALINGIDYGIEGDASQLLIYGYADINTSDLAEVSGLLYAKGKVSIGGEGVIYGSITAKDTQLHAAATVYYRPTEVETLDFGGVCDIDNDGIYDALDDDRDGDGYSNDIEEQFGSNPNDASDKPSDIDGDFIPDELDTDIDGDGVLNEDDAFPEDPTETSDMDNDGIGDNADTDRDGDGVNNDTDLFPDNANESSDLDNDGIGDNTDTDRDGDGISNDYEDQAGTNPNDGGSTPPDMDGDAIPDAYDTDLDGDGVNNSTDLFPSNPLEWADMDGDGTGDNSDADRDGDNFDNTTEVAEGTDPNNASDYPDRVAPTLHVNNPQSQTIESDTVTLNGTVNDPVQSYSGIASVTISSDKFADLTFSAQVDGSVFTADIPLLVEDNQLTIIATDLSGNTTEVSHTIDRVSPPKFVNVSPVTGSVIITDNITVAGEVHTLLPLTDVKFYLNEWQITPNGTSQEGIYTFSLPGIPLELGNNALQLIAETSDGSDSRDLVLTYIPENADLIPAPEISILSPVDQTLLSDQSFRVAINIKSQGGPTTMMMNGTPIATKGQSLGAGVASYQINELVSFDEGGDSFTLNIEATDTLGKTTTATAQYYRDALPPVLILNNSLTESPAINSVIESPYLISGTVIDANLSSILVNEKSIALQPGTANGAYDFAFSVNVAKGEQSELSFSARDHSGNTLTRAYIIQSDASVSIDALVPADSASYLSKGTPIALQVAARTSELATDETVRASINGTSPVLLTVNGTLATGNLSLPAEQDTYSIVFEVLNGAGSVIATTRRAVKVTNEADIPLALVRFEPINHEANVEPNETIELYFNKSIDVAKLSLEVRETLHGHTYINTDVPGLDFLSAKGHQLAEVNRDRELVAGSITLLPGEQTVAFYGSRHFGFNANVFVDVSYDGTELGRVIFKVRQLPTYVIGGITDQFGQPLSGVTVSIPEINRTTETNADGGYAFGFQEAADKVIPGGRYRMEINANGKAPGFGTQTKSISLQQGRKNEVGVTRLQELNRNVTYQQIQGGQNVILAEGELEIDLTNAQLQFENGRRSGNIHTQFLSYEQFTTSVAPGALPLWLFANQPRGTVVEGPLVATFTMPKLSNSYDYIPPGTDYVVLLGYNPESEIIEPVGVGRVENYQVISEGNVSYQSLDYFGYAIVDLALQPSLKAVAEGTKSMQQLKAELR